MYIFIGIFLSVCFVLVCLQFYRRSCMICKVRQMPACDKCCLLNELLAPFGFCYLEKQDLITSTRSAWQREFGYRSLFDRSAVHFGMVFDCEPVYFYYGKRTYRLELWKGQYGVNLGAEAGIYYAEGILSPQQFDGAHFQSVPDGEMLFMDMTLYHKGQKIFEIARRHWWLTGFCMGKYCEPEELVMKLSVTCKDQAMVSALVKSLMQTGYAKSEVCVCDLTVCIVFGIAHGKQPRRKKRFFAGYAQWKNRLSARLFVCMTKPFDCTLDRLIYLYYFLPAVFSHTCLCRKSRKMKFDKKNRCRGAGK